MLNAYDPELRQTLGEQADKNDIELHSGVYLAGLGPSFETPAEIRAFRTLGADVVGMSTVPEVILARHCDLKVAAVAVVVNYAAGMSDNHITHDETLHFTNQASGRLTELLMSTLETMN